jgi:thymidylate synthase
MISTINRNIDEDNYLLSLKYILNNGEIRETRNSKTLSVFNQNLTFNIHNQFPLLTTKRVYWKGVLEELLWFIKADTNAHNLADKSVHIWDANSTRTYLDIRNLNEYEEGECGPIYGYQWRHFNAPYTKQKDRDDNWSLENKGVDQLQYIINTIKTDPTSRRLFMSAWNPTQLDEMCLPPCHVSYQFYVSQDKYLSCTMTQRSGDMFLGVPFNIASTALLTYMIAYITNLEPYKVHINIGDAHIYYDHIDAVKEQLTRSPYSMSKLEITNRSDIKKIEDFTNTDFIITNYNCYPTIKAKMIA